jgi:acyl-CoA hydrolase
MIDFVTAEPFRPFRIHMASGTTFDVRHPEMIKVGRSSITVHVDTEDKDNQQDHWREVSLMLLEYVEPLVTVNQQDQSQT